MSTGIVCLNLITLHWDCVWLLGEAERDVKEDDQDQHQRSRLPSGHHQRCRSHHQRSRLPHNFFPFITRYTLIICTLSSFRFLPMSLEEVNQALMRSWPCHVTSCHKFPRFSSVTFLSQVVTFLSQNCHVISADRKLGAETWCWAKQ